MRTVPWIGFFVGVLLLSGCAGGQAIPEQQVISTTDGEYTDINVVTLQVMMTNKDFLLINTHIPFEGDIPDTDLSIPYDAIEQNLDLIPTDKDTTIVLYCRSDRMSGIAAETLVGMGYINIYNLDGGFNAWVEANLPFDSE